MLQTHYRSPIDFSLDSLQAAKMGSQRLARALALETVGVKGNGASSDFVQGVEKEFSDAMNNDFNTAVALSSLYALADRIDIYG